MDSTTICMSRVLISMVAIALLWTTSLSCVTEIIRATKAIPLPEIMLVVTETGKLYNESIDLRENYREYVNTVCDEPYSIEFAFNPLQVSRMYPD